MRSEEQSTAGGVRFVVGAPEQLFGLADLVSYDDGSVSGRIPTGPWLSGGLRGVGTLGALGVLADTVFGHANHVRAPIGRDWSVTTELSLELVGELPVSGEDLFAVARVAGGDARGALASGQVRTATGAVAVGSGRGRFTVVGPPPEVFAAGAVDHGVELPVRAQVASLAELVGIGAPLVEAVPVPITPRVTNPMGNLHGGVSFALADLAASAAVPEVSTTTSIRVAYLRPLPGSAPAIELTAVVVHRGRSMALVDVQGRGSDGRLVFAGRVVREG